MMPHATHALSLEEHYKLPIRAFGIKDPTVNLENLTQGLFRLNSIMKPNR